MDYTKTQNLIKVGESLMKAGKYYEAYICLLQSQVECLPNVLDIEILDLMDDCLNKLNLEFYDPTECRLEGLSTVRHMGGEKHNVGEIWLGNQQSSQKNVAFWLKLQTNFSWRRGNQYFYNWDNRSVFIYSCHKCNGDYAVEFELNQYKGVRPGSNSIGQINVFVPLMTLPKPDEKHQELQKRLELELEVVNLEVVTLYKHDRS